MKNPKTLLHVSVIGTGLVALCWDFFIALTFYELWHKKQSDACCDDTGSTPILLSIQGASE